MDTLTSQQVTAELGTTPGWDVADGQLTRTVTRKDFRDALLYVNAIGYLAEQANHHPDIAISWNKVTLHLVSHHWPPSAFADAVRARVATYAGAPRT